jgi:hypothetical protein
MRGRNEVTERLLYSELGRGDQTNGVVPDAIIFFCRLLVRPYSTADAFIKSEDVREYCAAVHGGDAR